MGGDGVQSRSCCVNCFAILWTVAHQALLSMEFPRQEYRSGLPSSPGDLPHQGIRPLLHCRQMVYPLSHEGSNFGLPEWLSGKESTCQAGDLGLIPGSGRSPGDGNGNPLLYSCLGNLRDRGAWQATNHEVTNSQTPQRAKQK